MSGSVVREGVMRALALAPGILSLGVVFGAAAAEAGIAPWATLLASAVVFAGASQFASVGLVAVGASVATVAGTVALVNARYFLMSAATLDLARRAGAGPLGRVALALGTVDEAFALQSVWSREAAPRLAGLLAVPATLWALWVAGTAAGLVVGARLPDLRPFGIDYVLPGLFIGLFGIFTAPERGERTADSREKLLLGLAALAVQAALALAGLAAWGLLLVPPVLALAWGWLRP